MTDEALVTPQPIHGPTEEKPSRPGPVQFRPGDLEPQLKKRADGGPLGLVAARDLRRYYEALRRSMPQLSTEEALALVDVANGTLWDSVSAALIWAEVANVAGLGAKWHIDQDALVAKLRACSYIQQLAVVDGCERFWSHHEGRHEVDLMEALARCGLLGDQIAHEV